MNAGETCGQDVRNAAPALTDEDPGGSVKYTGRDSCGSGGDPDVHRDRCTSGSHQRDQSADLVLGRLIGEYARHGSCPTAAAWAADAGRRLAAFRREAMNERLKREAAKIDRAFVHAVEVLDRLARPQAAAEPAFGGTRSGGWLSEIVPQVTAYEAFGRIQATTDGTSR